MRLAAWKQLALLLLLALAVRLAAVGVWQWRFGDEFVFPDSESYWSLARTIADGDQYQFGDENHRVFRTPGYPLLLAPIFAISGDEPSTIWGRVLSALFGMLTVAGVWCLARQLFDDRAAAIAGLITALYPGAVATSVLVLSEAPFCALMILQLILWTVAWNVASGKGWSLAMVAGMVGGLATLVRPSWILFVPFAVCIGLIVCRQRVRQLGFAVVMLGGMAAVMLPWWLRNAEVTGRFVPTTLQVGASLYDGLNPNATGASDMSFVAGITENVRAANTDDEEPFEVRLDQEFRSEAIAWAVAHPARALQLARIKAMRMWNIWPNEPSLSQWPIRLAMVLTYVPIMILGIFGALRTFCRGWPYILCWLPAVYFTLLHAIFIGSIRYRQPAMLGLIVLAAGMIGYWGRRSRETLVAQGDSTSTTTKEGSISSSHAS